MGSVSLISVVACVDAVFFVVIFEVFDSDVGWFCVVDCFLGVGVELSDWVDGRDVLAVVYSCADFAVVLFDYDGLC